MDELAAPSSAREVGTNKPIRKGDIVEAIKHHLDIPVKETWVRTPGHTSGELDGKL